MGDGARVSLAQVLSNLVKRAEAAPGTAVEHVLSKGLRISIVKNSEGEGFALVLSRLGVYPSAQEFVTVQNNWPWHLMPNYEPRKTFGSGPGEKCGLYSFVGDRPADTVQAEEVQDE